MPPARGGGGKGGKYTIVNVGAPSKRSAKEEAKEKELEEMSGYVEETDLSKSPMNLSGQPTKVYLNILLMRINNIDTVSASADIKIKVNQLIGFNQYFFSSSHNHYRPLPKLFLA